MSNSVRTLQKTYYAQAKQAYHSARDQVTAKAAYNVTMSQRQFLCPGSSVATTRAPLRIAEPIRGAGLPK